MTQAPLFPAPTYDVQQGDIYQLGRHRLTCADATDKADVARLFADDRPTMVVTSPPYAKQRDYDRPIACWDTMMMGALNGHAFADDVQMLVNLGIIHKKNEIILYWHNWIVSMRNGRWRHYSTYIWDKKGSFPGHMHGRLRPSYEQIFHLNKITVKANAWVKNKWHKHPSKVGPQASGLKKKNNYSKNETAVGVREFAEPLSVVSVYNIKSNHEASGHPAQMPIELAAMLIRTWKKPSGITYDPFAGSGTTILAAEREDVVGLGCEISPAYVAIALARWNKTYPHMPANKVAQ